MASQALVRLKAMTNRHSRRLEGRELEKAIGTATLLKFEAERHLREIERELRFLESKPATLRPDWKMPEAPLCGCGERLRPVAVVDCGELWLEWGCDCGEAYCDPPLEWPWVEEYVWTIDAAAAGFRIE